MIRRTSRKCCILGQSNDRKSLFIQKKHLVIDTWFHTNMGMNKTVDIKKAPSALTAAVH